MAHFARIENNVVCEVIAVDNFNCGDNDFPESEDIGKSFISASGLHGEWIQTSYTNDFRRLYAGIGYTYDPELDKFIAPLMKEETE